MTLNANFTQYDFATEQSLHNDLLVELIQIYGLDVYYIPRLIQKQDEVYRDVETATYGNAVKVEMYLKSVNGFEGEGDLLEKFGLSIRDRMTMTVAKSRFVEEMALISLTKPKEADLLYFPLNNKLFRINFVEHEIPFYQFGINQTFDLVCELFEYNNETFQTGISALDTYYTSTLNQAIGNSAPESVDLSIKDPDSQNEVFEEANTIIDFTATDPFSEGTY